MKDNFKRKTSVFIVPTGIGASIGGYAGDASVYAQKIAKDFQLIVNPNVVNAACFSGITSNMLYTEGWTITQLFKKNISLIPSKHNKIGVIFDKSISQNILNVHINTLNAVKTVYGIDMVGYEISEEEAGVEFFMTSNNISSGGVENPQTLLKAAKKMIAKGAEALAVVCKFDEPPEDDYKIGNAPDIIGGVEAIISHYLTSELLMPVVHSPAFENITITTDIVDSRAAAEYITPTFLPCLMLGLNNAPLIYEGINDNYLNLNDIASLIMPGNSLGASIVFDSLKNKIPVIAIGENRTVLNVDSYSLLGESAIINLNNYEDCHNYLKKEVYNDK